MKVKMTDRSWSEVTLAEARVAVWMTEDMKGNDSAKSYAKRALEAWTDGEKVQILCAEAEIAKNPRAWNCFAEHSGQLDVFVTGLGFVGEGRERIVEIGAFVSDIWELGGNAARNRELMENWPCREYRAVEDVSQQVNTLAG